MPGSELAGVVEAVGAEVVELKVGDAVAASGALGGFATHACVDAKQVWPLPAGFAFDDAAAIHQAGLRADVSKFTNSQLIAQRDKIVGTAT